MRLCLHAPYLLVLLLLAAPLAAPLAVSAQPVPAPVAVQPTPSGPMHALLRAYTAHSGRVGADAADLFDPALAPFFHGVASGDPLPDRVILWTRVTTDATGPVTVAWRIGTGFDAKGRAVTGVVNSGSATTGSERDYTVKVDADGLAAGTTYYYQFEHAGQASVVGRTRTAPTGAVDRLRFGVVSCSNYQAGFFNAYAGLAQRADLDAVLHLGDYLYEYEEGGYGDQRPGLEPETELIALDDYRIRHGFYKLDADSRALHQQHPLIPVWDDHESANDAWTGGAENHNEPIAFDDQGNPIAFAEEGDWEARKADAQRAYFEWMPIRAQAPDDRRIYRRIAYGDLADFLMVDTRLEGREEQLSTKVDLATQEVEIDTVAWVDPDRTLLGAEQQAWLTDGLASSAARWKIIGNQVMMVPLAPNPFWPAVGEETGLPEFTNLDAWDGYPFERTNLLGFIRDEGIEDVVVLTGDIHSSWAADLPVNPYALSTFPPYAGNAPYNPATGGNSVAVEFVTPSVTSATFADAIVALGLAQGLPLEEAQALVGQVAFLVQTLYPQVKTFDPASHGYLVLDLSETQAQADWYYAPIDAEGAPEAFGQGFATQAGAARLQAAAAPAPDKPDAPPLAPAGAPVAAEGDAVPGAETLLVLGVYPNPTAQQAAVGYVLRQPAAVRVTVFDVLGRAVATLTPGAQAAGVYALGLDAARLAPGAYVVRVEADGETASYPLTVAR